jgi:hypothetical protein
MLRVEFFNDYSKRQFAECRYAECRYAECRGAVLRGVFTHPKCCVKYNYHSFIPSRYRVP